MLYLQHSSIRKQKWLYLTCWHIDIIVSWKTERKHPNLDMFEGQIKRLPYLEVTTRVNRPTEFPEKETNEV